MPAFVRVAVDAPNVRPDQVHTYSLAGDLAESAALGGMVIVPYGDVLRRGWVLALDETSAIAPIRPVAACLDTVPLLTPHQVSLARWVSARTNASLARALAMAVPERVLDGCLPRLSLANASPANDELWTGAAVLLAALRKAPLRLDKAWLTFKPANSQVLPCLHEAGELRAGLPKGARAQRAKVSNLVATDAPLPALMPEQAQHLCSAMFTDISRRAGSVFLVTTDVWPVDVLRHLIRHAQRAARQTLILVPKPAQQAQGLLHQLQVSSESLFPLFTPAGGFPQPRPPVVIGSTPACLAAWHDLGLVVVLDEHDAAYEGDIAPTVHGRELALQAAKLSAATVLLVSATPSPDTMWRAEQEATQQVSWGTPPAVHVQVVDARSELRAGHDAVLTGPLMHALEEALADGEQALVLLNRRGTAALLLCRHCGRAVECLRCGASMAVYEHGTLLRCNRCGAHSERPSQCLWCNEHALDALGLGTEELVRRLRELLPAARIEQWDRDAVPSASADAEVVHRFSSGDIDILAGTAAHITQRSLQPVALAAAVAIDSGLHAPAFRASEHTYTLLSALKQRVRPGGTLLLQTFQTSHWVVQSLEQNDPALFYREELRRRQALGLPPFAHLIQLVYRRGSLDAGLQAARQLRERLQAHLVAQGLEAETAILGPSLVHHGSYPGRAHWRLYVRTASLATVLPAVQSGWDATVDPADG